MQKPAVDEKKTRDQLKAKRNQLLDEYTRQPMNTRLAIEIRLIDDQVATLTERLVEQRKSEADCVAEGSNEKILKGRDVPGDGLFHLCGGSMDSFG